MDTPAKRTITMNTCNGCSRAIFKRSLNKAVDRKDYTNTYLTPQHTKVWLDWNDKSMCGGSNYDTAHVTDKEMTGQ